MPPCRPLHVLMIASLIGAALLSTVSVSTADVTFTDIGAGLPGVRIGSVSWGDYDDDEDLDVLLTGEVDGGRISRVYRNDGGGVFTDIAAGLPGVLTGSVAWGDYDNDGDLDILLTGQEIGGTTFSRVYRNDGGAFTDIVVGLPGVLLGGVGGLR